MISDPAKQLLSQPTAPDDQDPILLFSDYNGDSVIVRIFRYGAKPAPETAAADWLRMVKQRCHSPSGELQTLMLAFPALGGWTENNVVAIVSGYDIISNDESGPDD